MNCLWLARDLPFPLDAGDKIYSAHLAQALAEAGAAVRFFGFAGAGSEPPADSAVRWQAVAGAKRSRGSALFSSLPLAAAIHDTAAYRRALEIELQRDWDAIVFDSYGSGWALKRYLAQRRAPPGTPPVLVHVAHNHEAELWRDMVRHSRAAPHQRFALWQNWRKVRALEHFVLRHADLTVAISDEDAASFQALCGRPTVVLTPGYSGERVAARSIGADCPRHALLLGSFRWVVKQENLRRFVALADPAFQRNGMILDVVGDVPQALLDELGPQLKATCCHGYVEDMAPHFARARLAVVPEAIGGGFKLKFLDYVFRRVPVATLAAAAAGLPSGIRAHLLECADLEALVAALVAHIDRLELLNDMQRQAFAAAGELFGWPERGSALHAAIAACRQTRADVMEARPAPAAS